MEFGINEKGVEQHISLVEEERRKIQQLLDDMKELADTGNQILLQRNVDDLNQLKQNIEGRIAFLTNLLKSYRNLKESIGETIRDLSYNDVF